MAMMMTDADDDVDYCDCEPSYLEQLQDEFYSQTHVQCL